MAVVAAFCAVASSVVVTCRPPVRICWRLMPAPTSSSSTRSVISPIGPSLVLAVTDCLATDGYAVVSAAPAGSHPASLIARTIHFHRFSVQRGSTAGSPRVGSLTIAASTAPWYAVSRSTDVPKKALDAASMP